MKVILATAAALLATAVLANTAWAQSYPNRPISVIYPFPAGSGGERLLRAINDGAARRLGQPVLLENRTGGAGRLGMDAVQKARPDGYLLTYAIDGLLIGGPILDPSYKLEAGRDYIPVAKMGESRLIGATYAGAPFHDIKGMIEYARANPKKLDVAVAPGGVSFFVERFREAAGIEVTFIPYKAASGALLDLIGGRITLVFGGANAKAQIDAGKLVGIVTSGPNRWPVFPNIPTLKEAGIALTGSYWFALVAPVGTPREVVARLNGAFNSALTDPDAVKIANEFGYATDSQMKPEELEALIKSEAVEWRKASRNMDLKMFD